MIFKRFFNRISHHKAVVATPPMRGSEAERTGAQQDAMRASMEAQVRADRKRRGATDVRPGETPSNKVTPAG